MLFRSKWLAIFFWILVLEYLLVAIIHVAEVGTYSEWGHKLSSRVFMHLLNPDEVLRTAGFYKGVLALVLISIELFVSIGLYRIASRNLEPKLEALSKGVKNKISLCVTAVFGLCLSFLMMRGGTQQIPINIDAAYFSNKPILNDLSVNSSYYFGNSFFLFNKSDLENFISEKLSKEDNEAVKQYFQFYPCDTNILTIEKPNVVFIIFEGWSAHGVGTLSGNKSATPFFDALSKEGVLFTNVYAANTTSEIGNATIFSGFTGVPENPLPLFPEKHRRIQTLSDLLKEKGYNTSYLFSGDLKYGNIKGFLTEHNFDRLLDENDFNPTLPKGKLNYYDEDLYDKFLGELRNKKEPFLSCAFTGSTHFPYDCPMKKFPFHGEEADYLNSMVYSDDCLKAFFREAKQQKWYKNTIFVLVSDHGHNSPGIASPYNTETFKIPLLLVGPALKNSTKGTRINGVFSQGDVAGTLANQLGLNHKCFPFSRNMLSQKTMEGAFISTIRGYGFRSKTGGHIFNFDGKQVVFDTYNNSDVSNKNRRLANACLFNLYVYFNELDQH